MGIRMGRWGQAAAALLLLAVCAVWTPVWAAERLDSGGREGVYAVSEDAALRTVEGEKCTCAYLCVWFWGDYIHINPDCPVCSRAEEHQLDITNYDPEHPETYLCQGHQPVLPGNDPECRHNGAQLGSWLPGLEDPELVPATCKYPASAAPPIQCGGCGAKWLWKLDTDSSPDLDAHLWDPSAPGQTTAPTCTQDGSLTRLCLLCGEVSAPIPALGHSWADQVCTVCGAYDFLTNKVTYIPSAPNPSLRRTVPDTSDGILTDAVYGDAEDFCVITYTIPEDYRGKTVQVNAAGEVSRAFARLLSGGDQAGPVYLRVVNRSGQAFSYEKGSFVLQSPGSAARGPAWAFDGSALSEEDIPFRSANGALEYLFEVGKGQLTGEQLTDEAVGRRLVQRGYENGVLDLHRFYLDYYNNFYSEAFGGALWSSLSQVPDSLLFRQGEGIFGGTGSGVRESDPEVAGVGYSCLYTRLLSVVPESGETPGELGEFAIGEYMRGACSFEDAAGLCWGALAAGESEGTLSGMTLYLSGGVNEFYRDMPWGVEVAFSLREKDVSSPEIPDLPEIPGLPEDPGLPEEPERPGVAGTGSLTVIKEVQGGAGAAAERVYTFDIVSPAGRTETVTITGAGSRTVEGLEPGMYFVTERNASLNGFRWSVSGEGFVQVEAGSLREITITNTYRADGPEPGPEETPGPGPGGENKPSPGPGGETKPGPGPDGGSGSGSGGGTAPDLGERPGPGLKEELEEEPVLQRPEIPPEHLPPGLVGPPEGALPPKEGQELPEEESTEVLPDEPPAPSQREDVPKEEAGEKDGLPAEGAAFQEDGSVEGAVLARVPETGDGALMWWTAALISAAALAAVLGFKRGGRAGPEPPGPEGSRSGSPVLPTPAWRSR